jgi:hypothetical protein
MKTAASIDRLAITRSADSIAPREIRAVDEESGHMALVDIAKQQFF